MHDGAAPAEEPPRRASGGVRAAAAPAARGGKGTTMREPGRGVRRGRVVIGADAAPTRRRRGADRSRVARASWPSRGVRRAGRVARCRGTPRAANCAHFAAYILTGLARRLTTSCTRRARRARHCGARASGTRGGLVALCVQAGGSSARARRGTVSRGTRRAAARRRSPACPGRSATHQPSTHAQEAACRWVMGWTTISARRRRAPRRPRGGCTRPAAAATTTTRTSAGTATTTTPTTRRRTRSPRASAARSVAAAARPSSTIPRTPPPRRWPRTRRSSRRWNSRRTTSTEQAMTSTTRPTTWPGREQAAPTRSA